MESTRPRVVWNCDEVAHGIARSAYRMKLLRLDDIPQQVAESAHTYRCDRAQWGYNKILNKMLTK